MITLFPNSGIQFIQLHYDILTDKFPKIDSAGINMEYTIDLLKREWTPISFNAKPLDYARIYWRFGLVDVGGMEDEALSPLLAFDTNTGTHEDGQLNDEYDVGRIFKSNNIGNLIPENDLIFKGWLTAIHERKKNKDPQFNQKWGNEDPWLNYKEVLKIVLSELSKTRPDLLHMRESDEGRQHLAGLIKYFNPSSAEDMDVNLYLDFGNSRSTCLFVEGNSNASKLKDVVFPLELVDYYQILHRPLKPATETERYIFDSRIEFRESIFSHDDIQNNSVTFKWPSIICVGKEASLYGNQASTESKQTGMSAPKRYLWDKSKRHDRPWHFSTAGGDQISGKILKYFEDYELECPLETTHSRSTMTTFFIIEILNQAYEQMNSHKHRKENETTRRRQIKRLVLTYPSGWTGVMRNDLLKRTQEAASIFCEFMNIENIEVELGLDEASASQIVFLESQIRKHKGDLAQFGDGIFFTNSDGKFRIASIDIGGGTTDMMVAEYDLNQYKEDEVLSGNILQVDGTSTGGDDVVKNIIEKHLLPQFKASADIPDEAFNKIFLGDGTQRHRLMRIRCMNIMLRPIAHYLLDCLAKNVQIKSPDSPSVSELISHFAEIEEIAPLLKDLKKFYNWNIQKSFIKPFVFPSIKKLEETIQVSSLKDVLVSYSKSIAKFRPSFVLLAGKISNIEIFTKIISRVVPTSIDRIIPLGSYAPGSWYPYLENGKISDPKTTVIVGMAISDIARNLQIPDGCFVFINDKELSNVNFIGSVNNQVPPLLNEDDVVMNPQEEITSRFISIQGEKYIIYRNLNDFKLNCNTIKKIGLIGKRSAKMTDLPKIKLYRNDSHPSELIIDQNSIKGTVIHEGREIQLNSSNINQHIYMRDQTISSEDYFLDTGEFTISNFETE